jgi:hypothetical protein
MCMKINVYIKWMIIGFQNKLCTTIQQEDGFDTHLQQLETITF